MFSLTVWNATLISLAATEKAFSSYRLILEKAAFNSSDGPGMFDSTPLAVLVPHFEQKSATSESFSPQFEQYAINTSRIKQVKTRDLSAMKAVATYFFGSKCSAGQSKSILGLILKNILILFINA
jgi:tetrahydromethanopterin S-methyltransferase subunit A